MADVLEVFHAAVSATCTTRYPKETLSQAKVTTIVGAVRPANESVAIKSARLATRILYEAGQQDVGLTIGKSELANTLADPGDATVSEFCTFLEESHMA